jgi:hypothetical protein
MNDDQLDSLASAISTLPFFVLLVVLLTLALMG